MQKQTYPAKYRNLLVQAGLIGHGVKTAVAYHNDKHAVTMDPTSETWMENPDEYEIDYRGARELACVYYNDVTGEILGDWKTGLTKDEIEVIQKECNVPVFDKNYTVDIYDGREFDLSIPKQMAEYRVLIETDQIAFDRNQMEGQQRFYITCRDDEQRVKREQISYFKEAIKLAGNLPSSEKRNLLLLLNYELLLGMSTDLSDDEVAHNFDEVAYDRGKAKAVVETHKQADKTLRLLLHQALDKGVLTKDGNGHIVRNNGVLFGATFQAAVDAMKADSNNITELQRGLAGRKQLALAAIKDSSDALQLGTMVTYDTTITDEESIKYWNRHACIQYFTDRAVELPLKEINSVDHWRRAVLDHHKQGGAPIVVEETAEPLTEDTGFETVIETGAKEANGPTVRDRAIAKAMTLNTNELRSVAKAGEKFTTEDKPFSIAYMSTKEEWKAAVERMFNQLTEEQILDTIEI